MIQRSLYLAEIYNRIDWEAIVSTSTEYENIYYFDTAQNTGTWWGDWGGTFDNPDTTRLQILFETFLTLAASFSALLITENTYFVDGTIVYVNLPKKPWQYFTQLTEVDSLQGGGFLSGAKDINNLSDIKYDGIKYFPILSIPDFSNSLPDAISGVALNTTFSFKVDNTDGRYDETEETSYFNTPAIVKRAQGDNPAYEDFEIIKRGLVESVSVDFDSFSITAADYNRYLTNEVCQYITAEDYPNAGDNIGKKIPIGYNNIYSAELIQIDKDTSDPALWIDYIIIHPDFITSVTEVRSSDGVVLTNTITEGVVRVTTLNDSGEVIEAAEADIVGKENYSLGDIATELINDYSIFKYIAGNWDLTETDDYKSNSALVGFYYQGGQLKDAIDKLFKNDVAFLFVKNNGLFTIRKWGNVYDSHDIENWTLTQKPKKDFSKAAKYYLTSAIVNYNKKQSGSSFINQYVNNQSEREIFSKYRKQKTITFETELNNEADAITLSELIIDRFGSMKEDVKISTGISTLGINLLDRVTLTLNINGRDFSDGFTWIVKENNPAQDTLRLEKLFENTALISFDDVYGTVDDEFIVTEE